MRPKKYMITQLGDERPVRRVYPRRDANCPVIAHVRPREHESYVEVPCRMINLCEDGCQITSDFFPRRAEDVYLTIPGISSKVRGKVRAQGVFTMNLKFAKLLGTETVDMIGRIRAVPKSQSASPAGAGFNPTPRSH